MTTDEANELAGLCLRFTNSSAILSEVRTKLNTADKFSYSLMSELPQSAQDDFWAAIDAQWPAIKQSIIHNALRALSDAEEEIKQWQRS